MLSHLIDESVSRLLETKFRLGIFDHPLVDVHEANTLVGTSDAVTKGRAAQRRSVVCLKIPRKLDSENLHLINFSTGTGADLPTADAVIINIDSPKQLLHPHHFFGSRQHEGDLDYKEDCEPFLTIKRLAEMVPVIAVVQMTRPAILTNLMGLLDGVYVILGVADDIMLEVITSGAETTATLPFELPSSMSAVASQRSDVPQDSHEPLFSLGHSSRD